eukprot:4218219-Amphidinium_carterae.1
MITPSESLQSRMAKMATAPKVPKFHVLDISEALQATATTAVCAQVNEFIIYFFLRDGSPVAFALGGFARTLFLWKRMSLICRRQSTLSHV